MHVTLFKICRRVIKADGLFSVLIILSLLIMSSCDRKTKVDRELDHVEIQVSDHPERAVRELKSIKNPRDLDDRRFSRWCLLWGETADKRTDATLLPSADYERASSWYSKHGTPEEQSRIGLYLGRSYVADGENNKAMKAYVRALDVSHKNGLHNISGYLNCYMGDQYELESMYKLAVSKYLMGVKWFEKAGNIRSND